MSEMISNMVEESEIYLNYSRALATTPGGEHMLCRYTDNTQSTPCYEFINLLKLSVINDIAENELLMLIRTNARRALFNLTADPKLRDFLVKNGALTYVIIGCREKDIVSVATLGNLAYEEGTKRKIVDKHDGVNLFVYLLSDISLDMVPVMTHAARGLFSISTIYEFKTTIVKCKAIDILFKCLTFADHMISTGQNIVNNGIVSFEQLQLNVVGALANLAIHKDNKYYMVECGILPVLLQLSRATFNNAIHHQIVRCMFSLTAEKRNRAIMVGAQTIVPTLLPNILSNDVTNTNIMGGFPATSSISTTDILSRQSNCLPLLNNMMKRTNDDCQANAVGAIGNIAMTDSLKSILVEAGTVSQLLMLLKTDNLNLMRHVIRAIFTLSSKKDVCEYMYNQQPNIVSDSYQIIRKFRNDNEISRDVIGTICNVYRIMAPASSIGAMAMPMPMMINIEPSELSILTSQLSVSPQSHSDSDAVVAEDLIRQSIHCLSLIASSTSKEVKKEMIASGCVYRIANIAEDIAHKGLFPSSGQNGSLSVTDTEILRYSLSILASVGECFPGEVVQLNCVPMAMTVTYSCKCQETRNQGLRLLASVVKGTQLSLDLENSSVTYLGVDGESRRLRHEHRIGYEKMMNLSKELVDNSGQLQINKFSMLDEDMTVLVINREQFNPSFANARDEDVEMNGSMKDRFCVIIHDCIAYARCETLHNEIMHNWKPFNVPGSKAKCKEVTVMNDAMRSEMAWTALIEYIYTNCVFYHIDEISKHIDITRTIASLARYFNLPRLSAYCYEINPKSLELDLEEKMIAKEPGKDAWKSRWGDDMEKLLKSMKYSDIVVNVVDRINVAPRSVQHYNKSSRLPAPYPQQPHQMSSKNTLGSPSVMRTFAHDRTKSSIKANGSATRLVKSFGEGTFSPGRLSAAMNPPLFNAPSIQVSNGSSPMIRKSLNFGQTHPESSHMLSPQLTALRNRDVFQNTPNSNASIARTSSTTSNSLFQSMEVESSPSTILSRSTLSTTLSSSEIQDGDTIIDPNANCFDNEECGTIYSTLNGKNNEILNRKDVEDSISKFDESENVSDVADCSYIVPQTPSKFRLGAQIPATPPHHLALDITKSLIIERQYVTLMKCHKSIIIPRCQFLANALAWKQQGSSYFNEGSHQTSSTNHHNQFNQHSVHDINENENLLNVSSSSSYRATNVAKRKTMLDKIVQVSAPVEVASVIMRYIYCGYDSVVDTILRDDPALALKILVIANELLLEGLVHRAQSHLSSYIDHENVYPLLCEIQFVNCPFLILNCIYFILGDSDLESRIDYEPNLSLYTKQMMKSIQQSWNVNVVNA